LRASVCCSCQRQCLRIMRWKRSLTRRKQSPSEVVVTKIDWSNPHVRLYLEVKDESNTVTWEVDMGSPNLQLMHGWKIDTYRRGDRVRVDAYPARDGSNVGYGKKVTAGQR
jgi:hypothetical protein